VLLEVRVEDSDTLEVLYRRGERFRLATPLQQVRLSLRLQDITFPRPEIYRFLLLADDEIIAQRKVAIVLQGETR
jgi:hypothetical protein